MEKIKTRPVPRPRFRACTATETARSTRRENREESKNRRIERYLRKLLLRRRRARPGARERPRGPREFLASFAAVSKSLFSKHARDRLSRVFISYKRGGTRRVVLHPNSRTGGTASAGFNHRGGSTLSVLQCRSRRRRSRTKGEVPVRAWVLNGVEGLVPQFSPSASSLLRSFFVICLFGPFSSKSRRSFRASALAS